MAVLKSNDGKDMLIDCYCGCDTGIRFRIDSEDSMYYCIMSYTNGNFYSESGESIFKVIGKKLKKIWAIVRNKDYYYSEIVMTAEDFKNFKEYINSIE